MRVSLLGALKIHGDDNALVPLKLKKCRALLAYLALHGQRAETRARLAGLLWGDMGEERARANLRQTVSSLRQAIGDRISADDEQVRLEVDCDVCELEKLAASADTADWERAAKLAVGELLADLEVDEAQFQEWLDAERRSLTLLVCGLWSNLARSRRAAGDLPGAEGALLCWLSVEPAAEEAHRALMQLYADTGRRAKALEQFNRCAEALQRSLSAQPDEETQALQRAIAESKAPAPAAAPALPARPSIAVAPFHAAPEDQWLGDGIAEDIIVALSRFEQLMVISRQSSFVFRDAEVDPRALARTFGVHYVLSGSVRRTPSGARLSVELADGQTGTSVWANSYEAKESAFSGFAAGLIEQVVSTLAGRVEADQLSRARRGHVQVAAAYEHLLKGKAYHHRWTREDNAKARTNLEQAIEADPSMAVAHAWLACVLVQGTLWEAPADTYDVAWKHAERAIALDEDESECHRIVASYSIIRRRWDEAERHQARALALNPNDDRIICQQGELYSVLGRPRDALPWIQKAMRLNPFHGDGFHFEHGRALYLLEDYAGARKALSMIRSPRVAHLVYLAACCNRLDDRAQAEAHLKSARALSKGLDLGAFIDALPYRDRAANQRLRADLDVS